jgi:hypothetical protein
MGTERRGTEQGTGTGTTVSGALWALARDGSDDRGLAGQIGRAYVGGLDVDGAAISVFTASPQRETLWASDPVADLLEDLQFTLGEGPCMTAATTGHPDLAPDLGDPATTGRWPMFAAAVTERTDVAAVFALPLQCATINLGVLDLYRRTPGPLPPGQLRDAIHAVDIAAMLLLGLRTDPTAAHPDDGAWGRRGDIHRAAGLLAAQLDITPTAALARLRAHAYTEHWLLADVARDVLARRLHITQ